MTPTFLENFNTSPHVFAGIRIAALLVAFVFAFAILATPVAQAQTFNAVYRFPGPPAGGQPSSALAVDRGGDLYGLMGWRNGAGTVYRLSRKGSGWLLAPLYDFPGGNDGWDFAYAVTPGPDGRVYGTTRQGGQGTCGHQGEFQGCGTIFVLSPPTPCKTVLCPWTKTTLYSFRGEEDGGIPSSELIFDDAGNLYGTAYYGGYKRQGACWAGCGTVYKLSPTGSGWTFESLYAFVGSPDGAGPDGHLTFDTAGNLYGTTVEGGVVGTVFELTLSRSGWTEKVLYRFKGECCGDGANPSGGVVFDRFGNLYGTTQTGGGYGSGDGTVYQLTPADGGWTETQLHVFQGASAYPYGVTVNAAGDVDGAINGFGAYGYGYVFQLTPAGTSWTFSSLHDFTGQDDGQWPIRPVLLDRNGNLWSASFYGRSGYGVIWEITP